MGSEIFVALVTGLLAAASTYIVTRGQVKRDMITAQLAENSRKVEIEQYIDKRTQEYMHDLEDRLTKRDAQIDQLEAENTDLKRKLKEADARSITQDLKIQTQESEIAGLRLRIQELERRIGTGELRK